MFLFPEAAAILDGRTLPVSFSYTLSLWLQNNLQRLATRKRREAFFVFFERQFERDEAAVEKFFGETYRTNVSHDFPGFNHAAADNGANAQTAENDVARKIDFDFAFRDSQQYKSAAHSDEIESVAIRAIAARHFKS